MIKQLLPSSLAVFLAALSIAGTCQAAPKAAFTLAQRVDDEYERLKKQGDSLFVRGEYEKAKQRYETILVVVPGYEQDAYAKNRIELSQKAITLRQQAAQAMNQNKGMEAVELYRQVLGINPNDPITKGFIMDYWSGEADKFYSQKKYVEAKNRYEEALKYAQQKDISRLQIQIQNSEQFIGPAKYKRLTGLKIAVGLVAVGAGALAVLTRSQIQGKLDDLNALSKTVDPDGDDIIISSPEYEQWQRAYDDAKSAKSKESMVTVYAGVAVAAVLAETVLLLRKPKPAAKGFSWQPAPTGVGLSLSYRF